MHTPACDYLVIDGLRMIDASVMPAHIDGNTNAPVIMIAEKGADTVLAAGSVRDRTGAFGGGDVPSSSVLSRPV